MGEVVTGLWEATETVASLEAAAIAEIAEVVNRQIGRLPQTSSLRASLKRCAADLAPPAQVAPAPPQPSLFVQPV